MERLAVGDIVLVLFPFSDLKGQKLRPALVLAHAEFNSVALSRAGSIALCNYSSKGYKRY